MQREIEMFNRKIKTCEHKIPNLEKEVQGFAQQVKEPADLDSEKMRLAQELQKKKGGIG